MCRVLWKKKLSFGYKTMIGRIVSIDSGGVARVQIAYPSLKSYSKRIVKIGINYLTKF